MGILEHLVNHHQREAYKKQTRPMNKFHPSTIGMCPRKIVFDLLMVPKPIPSDQLMRVFDNGHYLHYRYEQLMQDVGILVAKELKLEVGDISGHTDAWVRIFSMEHPTGKDYLVDFKSAFSKSFEWMVKNNCPKKEHKDQLMFYLYLAQQSGIAIDTGILLVENKDTQELWEYELAYDPAYGEALMQRALESLAFAKERKLPPIPKGHTPSYYKCATCDYGFYCHAGTTKNDGTIRYPNPFRFGSQVYLSVVEMVRCIEQEIPLPIFTEEITNGGLAQAVDRANTPSFL